jgi:hypothetical protein
MIEFIIPLNLPVRAVEITATTEGPSQRLTDEMARWERHRQQGTRDRKGLPGQEASNPTGQSTSGADADAKRAEIERELESLRQQRGRLVDAIVDLGKTTKSFEQQIDGLVREFQVATVELAHAVAAKLVFEEVDQGRYPIANLVHEVISRLDSQINTVVRLNPDDLALVQEHPMIDGSSHERSVKFVPDTTLARGDCKAKAGEITVIYELRRQVEEIRRQLLSTVIGHAET